MEESNFEGLTFYHYGDQKIEIENNIGGSFDTLPVIHELTKKTIFEIKRESGSILFSGCRSDWKYDIGILYYTQSNPYVRSYQTIKELKNRDINGKWAIVARKPAY